MKTTCERCGRKSKKPRYMCVNGICQRSFLMDKSIKDLKRVYKSGIKATFVFAIITAFCWSRGWIFFMTIFGIIFIAHVLVTSHIEQVIKEREDEKNEV